MDNYILYNGTWYVKSEDGELQELILTTEDDCMYGAY